MLNFEKYTSSVKYPNKSDYTTYIYYKGGKVVTSDVKDAVIEKVVDLQGYNLRVKEYKQEASRLFDEFKSDLFNDLGITDHTKAELLFNIARDMACSCSYSEVYGYAVDLLPLIE
jgi:hypothetical protein